MVYFLQYYVDVFNFLQYYVRILGAKLNDSHYFLIFSGMLTATEQYMYFEFWLGYIQHCPKK